ncbi:MAG: glycosyltransferase [Opitutaceae bacterium]|jgi:glycosyltransferase involved in cell wall biosynthesis|nr:glycosyltransferase [Opitutaceae bacterium]
MRPKALVYFLHNPMPPRSGAHRRCLRMLRGLREAGHHVTLASSTLHSETEWRRDSVRALIDEGWADRVEIFSPGRWEQRADALERRIRRRMHLGPRGLFAEVPCPLSLRVWFGALAARLRPDLLLVNYAWFDQLAPPETPARKVIETHDLLTVNRVLRTEVESLLAAHARGEPCPRLLDERFMDHAHTAPAPDELEVYDRYDDTIAISPAEETLLRAGLRHSRVCRIGVTEEPRPAANTRDGAFLLAAGPNPFNTQACLYFARKVWPLVRRACPSARAIIVGGARLTDDTVGEGLEKAGFVPEAELARLYAAAPAAVSCVFAGTGQQVKVVEALAHGVPVVALRSRTLSPLLVAGATGEIANDAAEMADHLARLFDDRARRARLGAEARLRVAADSDANRALPALFTR